MKNKKILVIDNKLDHPFGSLDLCRYLSSAGPVFSRRAPAEDLPTDLSSYSHIVLSGSRESCSSDKAWVKKLLKLIEAAAEKNIPTLGVCFGHQMIARAFGGEKSVHESKTPEYGWVEIEKLKSAEKNPLLVGLKNKFMSFQSHREEVVSLPQEFIVDAKNNRCSIQSFHHVKKPIFGVQFHPERNAEEGEESVCGKKGKVSVDSIFNVGKAKQCYDESVVKNIFENFLEITK